MKKHLLRLIFSFYLLSCVASSFGSYGSVLPVANKIQVLDFQHKDLQECTQLTPKADSSFFEAFNKNDSLPSGRIVGGNDANIEDYPWQVALLSSSGFQNCAGSILSEYWILTAAHCAIPATVRAGVTNRNDNSGQDRTVAQRIVHPLYTPYQNDVALLLLNDPLDFSDPKVQAIPIITQAHEDEGYIDPDIMTVITGWGRLLEGGVTSDILQVASIPVVSNEDAVTIGDYLPSEITEDMLCAGYLGEGGTDACHGDSGGPLVVFDPGSNHGYSLAGVTSWGYGCARPYYPGVWAKVSHFQSWIEANTGLVWNDPVTIPNINGFVANANGTNQIILNWLNNSDEDQVVIAHSLNNSFGVPQDGQLYNVGEAIEGGGMVIFRGSATSFVHSDLEEGRMHFYKAWAVNADQMHSIGRLASTPTDFIPYTLPFNETFERSSVSRIWWSQVFDTGTKKWSFSQGAGGGLITMAHSGNQNARFTSSSGGPHITKLVSPVLNLFFFEDVELSFWYAQEEWFGDQNELIIYYRTEESAPWVQIGSVYSSNITTWTQVEGITLPNPSANYQIAFEGIDNWGHANVIDEVQITGTYIGPPEELSLQDLLLENGDEQCFAATAKVYVAGSGSTFVVEDGGSALITAGQAIHLYDGAWIKSGGVLHAYIDSTGMFCAQQENMLMVRNGEHLSGEAPFIHSNLLASGLRLYPNPSSGYLTLEIPLDPGMSNLFIEVFNIMGKKVLTYNLPAQEKSGLDLSGQPPGLYLVRILSGSSLSVERIIIQ